jgi:hypothetical protein
MIQFFWILLWTELAPHKIQKLKPKSQYLRMWLYVEEGLYRGN